MEVRDRPGLVMAVLGIVAVVAGGLVSAVTAPLALTHGSWLAAYLVLVVGVGQVAMGAARLAGPAGAPESQGWSQLAAWNVGNVLVMVGTLVGHSLVVDLGGLGCVVGLVLALVHARVLPPNPAAWIYRAVLWLMVVSIPIGLVLSHFRHGS